MDVSGAVKAEIKLRDDGIVIARIYPGTRQSLDDARAILSAAIDARNGRRRPIAVDISGCEPLPAEVRRHYSGDVLAKSFSAIAMLIEANLFGRMIGNIYLSIARPAIPTRLFSSEADALGWLRTFV